MGLDRQNGAAKSPPIWIYGLLEDGKNLFLWVTVPAGNTDGVL
jgi:hypothetical protein